MSNNFENQMVSVFLEEALENLSVWETTCLSIEGSDLDESLNQLFRLAHNLKGSSLSVGLKQFGDYIHKVEELMTALKNRSVTYHLEILNLFFEIHSLCVQWVNNLQQDVNYKNANTQNTLDKVLACLQKKPVEEKKEDDSLAFGVFEENLEPQPTPINIKEEPIQVKEEHIQTKKIVQEEYLKVNVHKLDSLINYIGEIVVDQNIMKQKSATQNIPQDIKNVISQMGKNIQELQNIAISLRMMPLDQQFQKMHRIVRDLSSKQQKDINFQSFGSDVELDKIIVEKLTDPLTHLIRNAVDHGIESKKERIEKNKPIKSFIELKAMQAENNVKIYLKDDGKGLDEQKILKKAIEKGIVDKSANLSKAEIQRLIFQPGFSTKDEVSDVSGRGVGLDVVNKVISELKGLIEIETEIDKGTTFIISLPSSLAIIKGVIIRLNKQLFVVPESQLSEIVEHKKINIEQRANGTQVFTLRKEIIPIVPLSKILGIKENENNKNKYQNGIVIQYLDRKISFEVDEIVATQSIVLKQLSKELVDLPGIVATTVLGSGEPALVLNLSNLIHIWDFYGQH